MTNNTSKVVTNNAKVVTKNTIHVKVVSNRKVVTNNTSKVVTNNTKSSDWKYTKCESSD